MFIIRKRCRVVRAGGMAGIMLAGGTFNLVEATANPLGEPDYDLVEIVTTASSIGAATNLLSNTITGEVVEVPAIPGQTYGRQVTDPSSGST